MVLRQIILNLFRRKKRKAGDVEWLHANVPRSRKSDGQIHWIAAGGGAVLLLLACGLFNYFHFRHNSQFLLRDLSISSGATITDGLVREVLLRNQSGRNGGRPGYLFGPDIEEVREELLRLAPGISSVTITRRLPSRMDVRIVEREPVGRIGRNDQVIDGAGVIFPRNVGVEHLPVIVGMDGIQVQPGTRLDGMGLAAVRLLSAMMRPELALPVSTVDISRPDYLHLTLRDQRQVKLWWKGMDAPTGGDSRDALGRRLKRLLQAMAMAPQRQLWDATVPDDSRIFTPY
ncbi:MAG: FtsQ-type POTRA domain-containing protein [bacterium]